MSYKQATSLQYPLRPGKPLRRASCILRKLKEKIEFIESTWYLYRVCMSLAAPVDLSLIYTQATRDTMYLDIGKTVFYDLLLRAKVECGIAGIRDLRSNSLEDRMESFVLSETLKVRSQSPIR